MALTQDISDLELSQRVAVLKRFKTLLTEQREKFNEYLCVLEAQEKDIDNDNIENLQRHTELEQSIISEIFTIQKVIDPLEQMYSSFTHKLSSEEKQQTSTIKQDLTRLQNLVIEQNQKNQEKLKTQIAFVRQQISTFDTQFSKRQSIFANLDNSSNLIDIKV